MLADNVKAACIVRLFHNHFALQQLRHECIQ